VTYEDIDNCHESEHAAVVKDNSGKTCLVVIGETVVDKDGKKGYQFELLPDTKKYVDDRFYELKNKYENNPAVLNLIEIGEDIDEILDCFDKNIEFSQEKMIAVIYKGLHAQSPDGPLFNLDT
jgi:hypothetical protein